MLPQDSMRGVRLSSQCAKSCLHLGHPVIDWFLRPFQVPLEHPSLEDHHLTTFGSQCDATCPIGKGRDRAPRLQNGDT